MTVAKSITFHAVPDIIRTGLEIQQIINYDDRPVNSYTFAGKIDINGTVAYMAVIVRELVNHNNRKRFYLHKVYNADGNVYRFENEKAR
jgi:hypothetical protein